MAAALPPDGGTTPSAAAASAADEPQLPSVAAAPLRLHLLLRSPRLGQVKTRLARDVGDEAALALHRAFVQAVLAAVDASGLCCALWVAPAEDVDMVQGWLGAHRHCLPQPEGDLGDRLRAAFAWSFAQGDGAAAAIGSDLPGLTAAHLTRVAQLLQTHPAVIGPSPDGGYWCIGFTAQGFREEAFANMPWSTPELYRRTLAALSGLGVNGVGVGDVVADVDTAEDLRALNIRYAAGET